MNAILIGVIIGVCVTMAGILLNLFVGKLKKNRDCSLDEKKLLEKHEREIAELKRGEEEHHELIRHNLRMSIILGDGMIQQGVNGDVKKAFLALKDEVLKTL